MVRGFTRLRWSQDPRSFVTRIEAMRPSKGREVICKDNTKLNLTRRCKLRQVSLSSTYYSSVRVNTEVLMLMHENNSVLTKYRFFGSPRIATYYPRPEGSAGGQHVLRLKKIIFKQAIYNGLTLAKSTKSIAFINASQKPYIHAAKSDSVWRHLLHNCLEQFFISGVNYGMGSSQNAIRALF